MTIENEQRMRDELRMLLSCPAIGLPEYWANFTVLRRVGRMIAENATPIGLPDV